MPEDRATSAGRQTRTVGYALNVFAYNSLAELWPVLERDVLEIKRRVFPDETFPVELRFSERIVRELDCDQVSRLKYFLDTHDLALITVNGFVMPAFHGEPVKERVYLPAWHESDARLRFTNNCVDVLAMFAEMGHMSQDREHPCRPSVSVPFGALKPVTMDAVAPNILKAGEHAARHDCVIALEPEPGLCVETTGEVIEFFDRFVPDRLRQHLGICFDLSHQLVQFEDLGQSVRQLTEAGIRIAKVHVSNAAEMTTLTKFYEDSIYLHQVTGADAGGRRVFFSLDWPATAPAGIAKFRCHHHLPVFSAEHSTLPEVERFLADAPDVPLIIETYTLRGPVVDIVCRELTWVRERIDLSGRRRTV